MRTPLVLPSSQASQRGGISYALSTSNNNIIVTIQITFYYPIAEDTPTATTLGQTDTKACNNRNTLHTKLSGSFHIIAALLRNTQTTEAKNSFPFRAKQPPACDVCSNREIQEPLQSTVHQCGLVCTQIEKIQYISFA